MRNLGTALALVLGTSTSSGRPSSIPRFSASRELCRLNSAELSPATSRTSRVETWILLCRFCGCIFGCLLQLCNRITIGLALSLLFVPTRERKGEHARLQKSLAFYTYEVVVGAHSILAGFPLRPARYCN